MERIRIFFRLLFGSARKLFFGAFLGGYTIFALIRDEFLAPDLATRLRLGLLGAVQWYWALGLELFGLSMWALWDATNLVKSQHAPKKARFAIEAFRDTVEGLVAVRVSNNEEIDFTDKTAELIGLAQEQADGTFWNMLPMGLFSEMRNLEWLESADKISYKGHDLVKVARIDPEGIHPCIKGSGVYVTHNVDEAIWKFGLEIRGKLNNVGIIPERLCITFTVKKGALEGHGVYWAIHIPTLVNQDCDWVKTVSGSEILARSEAAVKDQNKPWWS